MDRLTLTAPDDWHLHVRDGDALATVIPHVAAQFARAIIMPNLKPPVRTTEEALAYRERICAAVPAGARFDPLMTLYLTEQTTAREIQRAKACGRVHGVKLYPAGATTHSDAGVHKLENAYAAIACMEEEGLPLLVHGEVTDPAVDIFDRERVFIETVLAPLLQRFPGLRVVLEHITTREAVEFVRAANSNVGATITAHHLLMNRNDMLVGGIRPHHYCLPVLKRETHRAALLEAATGGDPKFFLGTDSAPHPREGKESACGCAGVYTSHAALELYAEAFDAAGRLDRLEGFASLHGPRFYRLKPNPHTLTLERVAQDIPRSFAFAGTELIPLRAGGQVQWRVARAG